MPLTTWIFSFRMTVFKQLKHFHVAKFEGRLREMGVYYISDFTVALNNQKYKSCRNEFRIFFKFKTVLPVSDSPIIPMYGLALTEFSTIGDASNNNEYLIGNKNSIILYFICLLINYVIFKTYHDRYCRLYCICEWIASIH